MSLRDLTNDQIRLGDRVRAVDPPHREGRFAGWGRPICSVLIDVGELDPVEEHCDDWELAS